jgi:hypothetical protein
MAVHQQLAGSLLVELREQLADLAAQMESDGSPHPSLRRSRPPVEPEDCFVFEYDSAEWSGLRVAIWFDSIDLVAESMIIINVMGRYFDKD